MNAHLAQFMIPVILLFSAVIGWSGLSQRVLRDVATGEVDPVRGKRYVLFYRSFSVFLATVGLILVGLILTGR